MTKLRKAALPMVGDEAYDHYGLLRVLAIAEGYVMCRHVGPRPFVLSAKEWAALPEHEWTSADFAMLPHDPRKGGVWGDHTRAGLPWTDDEDHKLIVWGRAVGYDFVAGHDFGREPREGTKRIEWLRTNKPSLIAGIGAEEHRIEAEMQARFDAGLGPPDMRRKENRRKVH